MKKTFLLLFSMMGILSAQAVDDNTVEVAYNGTTATVTVADNIASYITVSSDNSSHVIITSTIDGEEITYNLRDRKSVV